MDPGYKLMLCPAKWIINNLTKMLLTIANGRFKYMYYMIIQSFFKNACTLFMKLQRVSVLSWIKVLEWTHV